MLGYLCTVDALYYCYKIVSKYMHFISILSLLNCDFWSVSIVIVIKIMCLLPNLPIY